MPAPDFASIVPQFELNAAGTFGANAIVAYGRFYTATGGMVGIGPTTASGLPTGIKNAAPVGWPGMGATLVGTGRYNIMHPPSTVVAMFPTVSSPSGRDFDVSTVRQVASGFATNPATGITQIQVIEIPTGGSSLVNPPTGTRFDLLVWASPSNSSGFTQF